MGEHPIHMQQGPRLVFLMIGVTLGSHRVSTRIPSQTSGPEPQGVAS